MVVGMARAAGTVASEPGAPRFEGASTLPMLIHGDAAFPGPGHRRRNAEPVAAGRLRHRRHDPHHRQQPARVHRHARRVLQHQLRERPRARLQDPDRPRQRRRSGRLPRGGAAGLGVPRAVPPRLPDRPGRLPPPRPQRGRRAGVHAAGDVQEGRGAPDGARAVRRHAGQAGHADAGVASTALVKKHFTVLEQTLRVAEAGGGLRRADSRAGAGRHRRRARRPACRSTRLREINESAAHRRRRASRSTRSSSAAASGAAPRWRIRTSGRSTGRPPRSWRWPPSSPTACRSGLTGEDVERGTFSQRHAVFHDADTGKQFVPLQEFPQARASFEIHNSPLTENADDRLRVRLQHAGARTAW